MHPFMSAGLIGMTLAASAVCCVDQVCGAAADWNKTTHVYKNVGGTKIEADVYRRADSRARPCLVWIHGGALIMGSREGVPGNLRELCEANDFVLVSLDYRLAPQVKLPQIVEDIRDAFHWIRDEGPRLGIDLERIVVAGGSAGGYLTMMSGICVDPRPAALVAYWGYGDVDGPWYTTPSEHYRKSPLVSREDALRSIEGPTVTGGDRQRGTYYLYLRQNGLWTKEVTGFDPRIGA